MKIKIRKGPSALKKVKAVFFLFFFSVRSLEFKFNEIRGRFKCLVYVHNYNRYQLNLAKICILLSNLHANLRKQ